MMKIAIRYSFSGIAAVAVCVFLIVSCGGPKDTDPLAEAFARGARAAVAFDGDYGEADGTKGLNGAAVPATEAPTAVNPAAAPPPTAAPAAYGAKPAPAAMFWYWISGYISPEGAEADLDAFARAGIRCVVICEADLPYLQGPVRAEEMGGEWWATMRAALRRADSLGIGVGITDWPGLDDGREHLRPEGVWRDNALLAEETGAETARRRFDAYAGEILRRIPAEERRALRFVAAGNGSAAGGGMAAAAPDTARMRRAAEYVAAMTALCRENGLRCLSRDVYVALRIGGPAAADGLLGAAKNVADGSVDDCRATASAARLCGVAAAAETGVRERKAYAAAPLGLKRAADAAYVRGIECAVLSGAVQQATATDFPGLNTWLFSETDRNNPWFRHAASLGDYIARCNTMLGTGRRVADIAVPVEGGSAEALAEAVAEAGYDADLVPAAMLAAAGIEDGKIVMAGCEYAAVVAPETLPAEAGQALAALAGRGARVITTGLSLPERRALPSRLEEAAAPDMLFTVAPAKGAAGDVAAPRYTHRHADGRDIYFLCNTGDEPLRGTVSLRSAAGVPELWDPVDGSRRAAAEFSCEEGRTSFAVDLPPFGSVFAVSGGTGDAEVRPERRIAAQPCEYGWEVRFSSPLAGPFDRRMYDLKDLSEHSDPRVRHFSGGIAYRTVFDADIPRGCRRIELDLHGVGATADVWINDVYAGGVWAPPYTLDITEAVTDGRNTLRIEAGNTWVNSIAGMMAAVEAGVPPADLPQLHFKVNTHTAGSPLPLSGVAASPTVIYYGR